MECCGCRLVKCPQEREMSSRRSRLSPMLEKLTEEKSKTEITAKRWKEIIEKVSIGAIKYSILKHTVGSDVIYDFEKSNFV